MFRGFAQSGLARVKRLLQEYLTQLAISLPALFTASFPFTLPFIELFVSLSVHDELLFTSHAALQNSISAFQAQYCPPRCTVVISLLILALHSILDRFVDNCFSLSRFSHLTISSLL
jgi:hypothetical protein